MLLLGLSVDWGVNVAVALVLAFALTAAEDANGKEDGNENNDGEDGKGKKKHGEERRTIVSARKQRRSTQPLVSCFRPK